MPETRLLQTIVVAITATVMLTSSASGQQIARFKQARCLPTWKELKPVVMREVSGHSGAVVIGITDGKNHAIYGLGTVNNQNQSPPDADTIFEIASLSKVLAGLVLADMCTKDEVDLNDPVQRWLPKDVYVPQFNGRQIKLLDLATHSSGLPRSPAGRVLAENYPTRRMHLFLNQYKLRCEPGTTYLYSNLGVTLMGEALAHRASMDYERLLQKRVCEPLHMSHTSVCVAPNNRNLFALGYKENGTALPHNGLFGCGASGAVKSSAGDLLNLLDAYMAPDTIPSLQRALQFSTVARRPAEGNSKIALGWFVQRRSGNLIKNGLLPGFRTFMGFSPRSNLGVVVLGASDAYNATAIGERVLQYLR